MLLCPTVYILLSLKNLVGTVSATFLKMDSNPELETMPQPSTESTEFTGKTTEVSHTEEDGEKASSSMPGTSGSSNSM